MTYCNPANYHCPSFCTIDYCSIGNANGTMPIWHQYAHASRYYYQATASTYLNMKYVRYQACYNSITELPKIK